MTRDVNEPKIRERKVARASIIKGRECKVQKLGRSCRRVVERVSHTALGGVLDWGRRREGRRGRNIVVRLVVGGL